MNTRFVRSSRWFRLTAIIALCLLAFAGITSFALNRSGHGQKDPSPIAYEEDEDPVPEGVAALMDTAKSLHGTIDTITYEQSYEGTTTPSRRTCTFLHPTRQISPRTSSI